MRTRSFHQLQLTPVLLSGRPILPAKRAAGAPGPRKRKELRAAERTAYSMMRSDCYVA